MFTESDSSSVDWIAALSMMEVSLRLTHLRTIQAHILPGCEEKPFVKTETWWEIKVEQRGPRGFSWGKDPGM